MLTPTKQVTIVSGGDNHEIIIQRCRDVAQSTADLNLTNDFAIYLELLAFLKNAKCFKVVPLRELKGQNLPDKISVALRHDVDADVVTAIACARALGEHSLTGSFYPLHTSHYYISPPSLGDEKIIKHKGLEYLLTALNETDVEIGLHNDALGLALDFGIDGAQVLTEEISWLRSIGITIKGTVAHNSAAVYNSECFEIFSGLSVEDRKFVQRGNQKIALGVLNPDELNLEYEGNFPIPRKKLDQERMKKITTIEGNPLHTPAWQHVYFIEHPIFERGYEYDIWLVGEDLWLLAGETEVIYPLGTTKMIEALSALPAGSRVAISIHPIYVSKHSMTV